MSQTVMREDARDYFVPFILGNTKQAHRLSLKIFRSYGIVSLICGNKRRALDLVDFSSRFLRLCQSESPRLLAEQLIALSEQCQYTLPILIATSEEYEKKINEVRSLIEQRFIISRADEIFTLSPLASIKKR